MTFGTLAHRPAKRRQGMHNFDRLMADLYRDFDTGLVPRARYATRNPVDYSLDPQISAEEFENEYRVVADIPGVEAKDLEINVENGVLTLRGKRFYGSAPEVDDAEVDAEVSAEAEGDVAAEPVARPSAKFERKLRFRGDIVDGAVSASLRNGVLTVTIPKPEPEKPEVRTIPVETA